MGKCRHPLRMGCRQVWRLEIDWVHSHGIKPKSHGEGMHTFQGILLLILVASLLLCCHRKKAPSCDSMYSCLISMVTIHACIAHSHTTHNPFTCKWYQYCAYIQNLNRDLRRVIFVHQSNTSSTLLELGALVVRGGKMQPQQHPLQFVELSLDMAALLREVPASAPNRLHSLEKVSTV